MPDFSHLEYSDWLDTLTLCITVAGISLGLIYSQILHSPPTRQRFIAVLQKSKVRNLYQAGVVWLLAVLQRFYSDKASLRAFNVSLLLAYVYPILFFLFSSSYLGGSDQFSGQSLLPADSAYRPWIFLAWLVFAGISIPSFYLSKCLEAWGIRQFERRCSPLWSKRTWKVITGFLTALISSYAFSESIWGIVFGFVFGFYMGVVVLALVFGFVFFLVCLFVVAGSVGAVFDFDASFVFIVSGMALLLMFSLVLTGIIAAAASGAGVPSVVFVVAFAFSTAVYSAWLGDYHYSLVLLFFYLCMPFLNALLDWLSWWVSRFFMERTAIEQVSVRVIVLDVALDFVVAVLFMLALVLLLPAGAMGLDALYANAVDAKTGLAPQTNWQDYAVWARDEPWGKGAMVTLMLMTTLIPTLLHIFLGLMAFYIHAFKGQALAAFLSAANPEDNIANMQASVWVFGYAVLAVLSMWLLWLGINQLWHLPIAEWLYNFAKFFYPLP